jgi:RNA polymerase sigma-70 factor (ECF subfamily)
VAGGDCMLSDQDLVARILERDAHAFEVLFERYAEMIRRHLARIVDNEATAQDVLQETFLRVWTRAEQWDGRGSFAGWLYRIATNLAFNHLRSVRRRREQPLEIQDDEGETESEDDRNILPSWMADDSTPGPDAAMEQAEQQEQVQRLVASLPPDKREVLILVHEMEMSIHDAADELGIPEGTAKSRLHYAKKRLARQWQDMETQGEGF